MSGIFLRKFLSVATVPPNVAPEIIAAYQHAYPAEMAKNVSLQGMDPSVLAELSAEALCEAIEAHRPEALEMVLSTKEARDVVIRAILDNWILSGSDQMRLVSRVLSKKSADAVVASSFAKKARLIALERATPPARLAWMVANEASDKAMAKNLFEIAPEVTSMPLLVSALLLRRPLRSRALRSSQRNLQIAACWTELEERDQAFAVEFALGATAYATAFDPVIGLLNQPGLAKKHRRRLEQDMDKKAQIVAHAGAYSIHARGLGRRKVFEPRTVADTRIANRVHDLLVAASRSTRGDIVSRERAVTIPLLYELSRNEHLNRQNLLDLKKAMAQHVDLRAEVRIPALGAASFLVQHRLGVTPSEQVLKKAGMYPASLVPLESYIPSSPPPITSPGPNAPKDSWTNVTEWAEKYTDLLSDSISTLSHAGERGTRRLGDMGPTLQKHLGDGSSEVSKRAWMNFLGLVEDDPDVAIKTVIATAKKLASAE